jgi:HK97 gp10 family phage protein
LDIKVEGLESLLKALDQIAGLNEPAAKAIELYLQKVVADAKADVPVRTGTLQRSIMFWGGEGEYYVGSQVHYAGYVEFGTSRMAPRPYLTPALMQNIPMLRQTLGDMIEKWIESEGSEHA